MEKVSKNYHQVSQSHRLTLEPTESKVREVIAACLIEFRSIPRRENSPTGRLNFANFNFEGAPSKCCETLIPLASSPIPFQGNIWTVVESILIFLEREMATPVGMVISRF